MIPGDLGGRLTQVLRLSCQWMAVKFCGRDGQIAEAGARLRMLLVVIIQGRLHDDRLKRRPQRSSCQRSSRWCYAKLPDGKGCGVAEGGRDPHRVLDVASSLPSRSSPIRSMTTGTSIQVLYRSPVVQDSTRQSARGSQHDRVDHGATLCGAQPGPMAGSRHQDLENRSLRWSPRPITARRRPTDDRDAGNRAGRSLSYADEQAERVG